eukprot:5521817-Pyramimonas_sp.AAC.1
MRWQLRHDTKPGGLPALDSGRSSMTEKTHLQAMQCMCTRERKPQSHFQLGRDDALAENLRRQACAGHGGLANPSLH